MKTCPETAETEDGDRGYFCFFFPPVFSDCLIYCMIIDKIAHIERPLEHDCHMEENPMNEPALV